MEISQEKYTVTYQASEATVCFEGSIRLHGGEPDYLEIVALLNQIAESEPPVITLNLEQLQFLNSLGISLLSKFVINVRKRKTVQMVVRAHDEIPWQRKSLKNLQRLMPNLQLNLLTTKPT